MMNAYDPVLAEFYVQDQTELGGYPQFDLFFNAQGSTSSDIFQV